MFFGPMIALIVLAANHYSQQIKIWWFLHNRKIALRNKGQSNHPHQQSLHARRSMAYQAKGNQVSISEPIPLNQQVSQSKTIGLSGSHYAHTDPWAETSATVAPAPTATLVSALTTPTLTSSATAAAFGISSSAGYRLEPLPRKPLEPLPPPVPPHQTKRPPESTDDKQQAGTNGVNLRPGE